MAANILTATSSFVWVPMTLSRLWFFPDGSEYLHYSSHFHLIYPSGFRQNLPLCDMFVIVLSGKLSIKDYYGETTHKVSVCDQVWYMRGTLNRCPKLYAKAIPRRKVLQ